MFTISKRVIFVTAAMLIVGGFLSAGQTAFAYSISVSATNGTISVPPSPLNVTNVSGTDGASKTFALHPSTNFVTTSVLWNAVAQTIATSYTFSNITGVNTFSVTFSAVAPHTLTASAGAGGSISPNGGVSVADGGSETFAVTANAGFTASGLTVDGSPVSVSNTAGYTYATDFSSISFSNVLVDHTIAASFTANPYAITASAGAGGSISPSGSVSVSGTGNQSFAITPNAGFSIAGVSVDGSPAGAVANYSFTNVIANHTISATFAANTYAITASAGANGSISPSGVVSVSGGNNQSFAITANTGYHIADVTVGGVSVGAVTNYAFTNVVADQAIAVTFAIDVVPTHIITASANGGGSISPSGSVVVSDTANQSFTIASNSGFHISDVLVDGSSVTAVTGYTITHVVSNHTISAIFAQDAAPANNNSSGGGGGGGGGGSGPSTGLTYAPTIPPQIGIPAKPASIVATTPAAGRVLGVSTFNFARPVVLGSTGTDVTELQNRLIAEGFLKSKATGFFGSLTQVALKAYQAKHGINPTGTVGPLTRGALNGTLAKTPASTAPAATAEPGMSAPALSQGLKNGSAGSAVETLQKMLATLGFFKASPTGYFGSQTAAAVKAYQTAKHIEPTGTVGPLTRSALNKENR